MKPMKKLNLFVYGTLMEGGLNHYLLGSHERPSLAAIGPARLWTAGLYPALELGEDVLYYSGSMDYKEDIALQDRVHRDGVEGYRTRNGDGEARKTTMNPREALPPFRDWILGEFYRLPYTSILLSRLDRLEGFRGRQGGFYERVLTPVWLKDYLLEEWAWVYVIQNPEKIPQFKPLETISWDPNNGFKDVF
jgi:gamma-glutamylcyclotransferase (GGCT)/AIG2-like uncharacterized protein YtfP